MDQFNEWWGKGKGSEQWSKAVHENILGAIKVAFNAGVASEKNSDSHAALVKKLDEYIEFIGDANQAPTLIAFTHGWRCPEPDMKTGVRLRSEIVELRKSI